MLDLYTVALAQEAYHLETDIPLVIQGFILIGLALLTYWNERKSQKIQSEERLTADKEENRHDEHMAQIIVQAMKDDPDIPTVTPQTKESN